MVRLNGFEDSVLIARFVALESESGRPVRTGNRIFDNKVERASREKSFEFKFERSHKNSPSCFVMTAVHRPPLVNTFQVSNESLILAQNQRWRRA